jgi:hypothetical protein
MKVKGTVYTTTKVTVIEAFGEERWKSFMAKLTEKDKYFKDNIIMSITLVPLDKIIIFLDELINECFNNDKNSYLMFGMVGAKFALSSEGPYQSYLLTKDIKQFVESALPKLWATYYDGGTVTARLENNVVHVKITGFPIEHFYYEQLLMGYFKQALKIFGKKTVAKQVRSLASGDDDIYFQFELKDS